MRKARSSFRYRTSSQFLSLAALFQALFSLAQSKSETTS